MFLLVLLDQVCCLDAAAVFCSWKAAVFRWIGGVFHQEGCAFLCVARRRVVQVQLSRDELCRGRLFVGRGMSLLEVPSTAVLVFHEAACLPRCLAARMVWTMFGCSDLRWSR